MITRLEIEELFGLYSYDLDFTNADESLIKIITGPNGYGKTTIIRLISALYNRDYDLMFSVRFKRLVYHFDGRVLEVSQTRIMDDNENIDIPKVKLQQLNLCFYAEDEMSTQGERFEIVCPLKGNEKDALNGFNVFMNSRQCFYIADDRLVSIKTDYRDETLCIDTGVLPSDIHAFKKLLDTNGYKVGEEDKLEESFRKKLDLFRSIVANSCFADKTMQIHARYGLRFKSHNELGEFIDIEKLSSGEKHILVQCLELLFHAKDGMVALVDEPELSFHPAWLNQYIGHIESIQTMKSLEGKPFQIILATHSPQLIGQRWDKCLDLYEQRR